MQDFDANRRQPRRRIETRADQLATSCGNLPDIAWEAPELLAPFVLLVPDGTSSLLVRRLSTI
jgi:hypothetical protein